MTMDVTHFVVPGELTYEQREAFYHALDCVTPLEQAFAIVGTPVQPCADVETVGYAYGKYLSADHSYKMIDPVSRVAPQTEGHFDTPLVRRTDMEAQVAVRDAEIARLRRALTKLLPKASNAACGRSLSGRECRLLAGACVDARAALNEGTAG
ncbi:hypothetical protein [Novacetimonas sp. GS1]|uniref:hypothetical protein n=1 Tax=Novacetimonas sp. GS1 TaxID=3119990 RepID=UPI002FCCED2A